MHMAAEYAQEKIQAINHRLRKDRDVYSGLGSKLTGYGWRKVEGGFWGGNDGCSGNIYEISIAPNVRISFGSDFEIEMDGTGEDAHESMGIGGLPAETMDKVNQVLTTVEAQMEQFDDKHLEEEVGS